jgi:hypothetical protein
VESANFLVGALHDWCAWRNRCRLVAVTDRTDRTDWTDRTDFVRPRSMIAAVAVTIRRAGRFDGFWFRLFDRHA